MLRKNLIPLLLLAAAAITGSAQQGFEIPRNMKPYFLAMLVRPETPLPPPSKDDMEKITRGHLAYIRARNEAGQYVIAGPATDNSKLAGIVVLAVASADDAAKILKGDPMIQSGVLTYELHPIMLPDLSTIHLEFPK